MELLRANTLKVAAIANGSSVATASAGFSTDAATASADLGLSYAIAAANYQYAVTVAEAGYEHGQSLGAGGGHWPSLTRADTTYRDNMAAAMVTWTGAVSPAKAQLYIDQYSQSAWEAHLTSQNG